MMIPSQAFQSYGHGCAVEAPPRGAPTRSRPCFVDLPERVRYRLEGIEQIDGPYLEHVGIVAGESEHAVAAVAEQLADLPGPVTMIDRKRFVGFVPADAALAVLL